MSYHGHQQVAAAACLPTSAGEHQAPSYVPPLEASYAMKDGAQYPQPGPAETRQKGGGFWRGFCAGLCCCCLLDMCC